MTWVDGLLWRLLERSFLLGYVDLLNAFTNVFC